jgi:integrase
MSIYDRWHTRKPRLDENGEPVERCKEHKQYPSTDHALGDRWQVRWRDENKRQCKQNFPKKGGNDPETCAEAFDAKITAEINSGTYIDPAAGRITLRAYAENWRKNLVNDPNTLRRIDDHLKWIYKSAIADVPMAKLAKRPSSVQQWIKSMEGELSPATIAVALGWLSSIFAAAIDDGIAARNPTRARSVKTPTSTRKKILPWTFPQVQAAAENLPERCSAMADLGVGCGLRQGEIFGVGREDIDFLHREIHVRRQVRVIDDSLVFALPKGDKIRTVPMPDHVGLSLARHIAADWVTSVTLPWDIPAGDLITVDLLFTTPRGKAWRRNNFARPWHTARDAAGVPATRENGMHVLRHTAASAWLAEGVDINTVAEYLGHEDPGFTLRTYTHLMPSAADRARKAMDAFFEGKITEQSAQNVPSDGAQ